jgi:hypothetical protein
VNPLEPPESLRKNVSDTSGGFASLPTFWLRFLLISAALLVPCFWHRHLEAGDLGSHLYNAWIAQLTHDGRAPGLWLSVRWNNVFFDFLLSGLGSFLSWAAAERIATGTTVLVFVWGAFALVSAVTRHAPWRLLPCLAIIGYGWVFEMGFMNCYLSIGLAFFALAILIGREGWHRWLACLLAPLIWLAHPLGLAIFFAIGAYVVMANHLSARRRPFLFLACACLLVAIHLFIRVHYRYQISWKPQYVHDGFDQLLLFGSGYLPLARLFRIFVWICILLEMFGRRQKIRSLAPYLLPAELYALTLLGVLLLPTWIDTERLHRMGFLSIGFLTERLTIVLLVLICCLVGVTKPQKWQFTGFSLIAVLFFGMLYKDTAAISRTEDQLDSVISTLPASQRVVASLDTFPLSNVGSDHVIDQACIGRCFSYNNYEPKVGQFRVRANAGNPFVMTDTKTVDSGRFQNYVVQQRDLPLYEISWCDSSLSARCARALAPGDATRVGFRLYRTWVSRFNRGALLLDLLLASAIVAWTLVVWQGIEKYWLKPRPEQAETDLV